MDHRGEDRRDARPAPRDGGRVDRRRQGPELEVRNDNHPRRSCSFRLQAEVDAGDSTMKKTILASTFLVDRRRRPRPSPQPCRRVRRSRRSTGPPKGTLVIVGGGNLNGSGINEKFIELAGGPEKNFVIVPTAGGNRNAQGELDRLRRAAHHRAVDAARAEERADAAHARSEGGRHRGVREGPARRRRRLVQRRPPVEHRRFVREHADLPRVPQGARARRRDRRQLRRRDDPGRLPGARRHVSGPT